MNDDQNRAVQKLAVTGVPCNQWKIYSNRVEHTLGVSLDLNPQALYTFSNFAS